MKLSCLDIDENGVLYRDSLILKFKYIIGITYRENVVIQSNRFNFCSNLNSLSTSNKVESREISDDALLLHYLDVHYFEADKKNKYKWRKKTLSFESKQLSLVMLYERDLRKSFEEYLSARSSERPKRLLVFINPVGGKGSAKRKYDKYVRPVFDCAGIEVHVVMTTHQNHAREHVQTEDVGSKYCGVVGVGGEGIISEIVNGLLGKQQLDVSKKELREGFDYEKFDVRIGVIPCGSTNALAYTLQGLI